MTIEVVAAPPFLTVQDLGRPGYRHLGIPAGGAMDRWAMQAANTLVGNAPGAAVLEWAVGGGTIRFAGDTAVALAGADADATLAGAPAPAWCGVRVRAGEELVVHGLRGGAFLYLAVRGGIDVPSVLGSRATYLPANFGGHDGRLLRRGDRLSVATPPPAAADTRRRPEGACPPDLRADIVGPADDAPIRCVRGPQAELLAAADWRILLGAPLIVAAATDRAGYRLGGPPLAVRADAALPSEPGCAGALQLPPGGQPIILMADAPTVGGYPKPLVVCSADLGRVAQLRPGDTLRLTEVDVATAQRAYRRRRLALWTLRNLGGKTKVESWKWKDE